MIYVDNAATTYPKPPQVLDAVYRAMRDFGANPGRSGHPLALRASQEVYDTREEISSFFHADGAEYVAFTANTTYALNMVIKGLLKPGDHVIISSLEHNSVLRPVAALQERGISYSVAEVVPSSPEQTVQNFAKKITQRTKAIACTLASNVCGYVLPFEEIGALAKKRGLFFIADGAQAAGYLPLDIKKAQIDFLCIPAHKGLYGPMGLGAIVVNCKQRLGTLIEGGSGMASREIMMPEEYPERLEGGTINLPAIAGLRAGIQFLNNKDITMREQSQYRYLTDRMRNISGIKMQEIAPQGRYVPVCSFTFDTVGAGEGEALLGESGICVRSGLHCAPLAHDALGTPEGSIRISLGAFHDRQQLDQVLMAVKRIAAKQ